MLNVCALNYLTPKSNLSIYENWRFITMFRRASHIQNSSRLCIVFNMPVTYGQELLHLLNMKWLIIQELQHLLKQL